MLKLSVVQEQLLYTAFFSKPLLELWGEGKAIIRGLFEAFSPLGSTFSDIRIEGQNPADQLVTLGIGTQCVCRFRFDRVEVLYLHISDDTFERMPRVLDASTSWIRAVVPQVRVSTHQIAHSTHCRVEGGTAEKFLKSLGVKAPPSGGLDKGPGLIFHWEIDSKQWTSQLVVDKSLAVENGLFLGLTLLIKRDKIDFPELAYDGRQYLLSVLDELGLSIPSFQSES